MVVRPDFFILFYRVHPQLRNIFFLLHFFITWAQQNAIKLRITFFTPQTYYAPTFCRRYLDPHKYHDLQIANFLICGIFCNSKPNFIGLSLKLRRRRKEPTLDIKRLLEKLWRRLSLHTPYPPYHHRSSWCTNFIKNGIMTIFPFFFVHPTKSKFIRGSKFSFSFSSSLYGVIWFRSLQDAVPKILSWLNSWQKCSASAHQIM